MRISPVHGDQWPVAALHSPVPPAEPVSTTTTPPAVVQASAAAADNRSGAEQRHGQSRQAVFDPPLIAQRAVLGLPVGSLIAQYAEAHGVPFATVSHAVHLAMPVDKPVDKPVDEPAPGHAEAAQSSAA